MSYLWVIIAFLVIAGGIIAYFVLTPSGKQEAACALVIDRTSSSASAQTVAQYKTEAKLAVEGCSEANGSLSIYYFSQGGPKINSLKTPPYELWGAGRKKSLQDQTRSSGVDQALGDLNNVFATDSQGQRGSDLITALYGVSQNLNQTAAAAGVSKKYLVVLTDGIQTSDSINVSSFANGDAQVQPIVSLVSKYGLVPSLAGTQVTFVGVLSGVNATTGQPFPGPFETKLRQFWTSVIQDGRGHLCAYEPTATNLPAGC